MPFDPYTYATPTGRTTNELESWRPNATERFLSAQGQTNVTSGGKYMVQGQWLRKISLIVYGTPSDIQIGTIPPGSQAMPVLPTKKTRDDNKQNGLDLSQLRINFRLKKFTLASPNLLEAKIYNLSPETIKKVRQYGRIQLAAGYEGDNYGMIFDGTIVLFLVGKDNPVDSYLEIRAGDLDEVMNAAVGLTWPAGTSYNQKAIDMLKVSRIPIGEIKLGPEGEQHSLRSTSFIGPLDRGMRTITNATSSDFWIENGKANIISWKGYAEGTKVVLTPQTGLVGIPKITPQGIEAECLLNAKLRLGTLVEVDSSLITDVPYIPGTDNPFQPIGPFIPGAIAAGNQGHYDSAAINPKGVYKILLLDHSGDTRGNTWYSHIVACAAGDNGNLLANVFPGTALHRSGAVIVPGT